MIFIEFFKNIIYIRIKQDWMSARSIATKKEYQNKPIVALDGKKSFVDGSLKLLAVGDEALAYQNSNNPAVKVVNAFSHPRVIINDYDIAVATLRYFISKIANRPKIVRPFIVIHPLGNIEGEITYVEARALREAGESAGARKALVWVGRELSDSELASLQFPTAQGKLLEEVPVKKSFLLRR